jgi:hypothetical protein
MKRIGIALLLFLVSFSLFAASKPSIEGRAAVADENVFPIGLFAKAIGFLPGDSVMVTNPVTGISVNVLILGTPEKEGIVILLSPEAASRLFITKDSNTLVSVTKRIVQTEATSPKKTISDPDNRPEDAIPLELDEKLRNQDIEHSESATVNPKIATSKPNPPGADDNVRISEEKTPSATSESEEILGKLKSLLDAHEIAPKPEAAEIPRTPIVPDSNVKLSSEPATPDSPQITSPPREVVRVTETATGETVPQSIGKAGTIPVQPPNESVKMTDTAKKAEGPVTGTVRLIPATPVKPQEPDNATKKEEGIPLIPPPVSQPPATESKHPVTPSINKILSIIVEPSKLRIGSYYIQIATMSNEKNINSLLSDYSDKYPIALVPSPLRGAYQVLIGPLNIDEYGAVLERFKNNGFKDAFVRKIR